MLRALIQEDNINTLVPLLNVADASRSVHFYTKHFGFSIDKDFTLDGKLIWARLSRGPIAIMINVSEERAARSPRPAPQTYDDVVLYFMVDNARTIHDELLREGANPGPVERQDYGAEEFTMRDPDGYELAFASPIRQ